MTEHQEKAFIRSALLLAAQQEFADLNAVHEAPSPRQARRFRSMLADPFRYLRRIRRPWWKKTMHTAAMLAVTVGLSVSLLCAVSPTVRAALKQWFMEIRHSDIVYYFTGETHSDEIPEYMITALPKEYVHDETVHDVLGYRIRYKNAAGQRILFWYSGMEDGSSFWANTEQMEVRNITVNDCPGQIFISADGSQGNALVWFDEVRQIRFCLDGFVDETVLLHMAESVSLAK